MGAREVNADAADGDDEATFASPSTTARLYSGCILVPGELHSVGLGLASVFTSRSPERDDLNEDSAAIIPFDDQSGLLVVADGAGGLPSGAKASELAVGALRSAVRQAQKKGEPLRLAVLNGIEKASRDIAALCVGAATTLAVAEIFGTKVRTYHVGDSQILVVGQRGKVKLQTMSHSPVGYAIEAGLLNAEDAMTHEARHIVSNLVGLAGMHIELGPVVDLAPLDTVVIASDGLFDNLHTDEIVATSRSGPLLAITREMAEKAHKRMSDPRAGDPSKPDDLTFIVYRRRVSVS